jgi:putative NIF3 family GTP cyclohydrolase 1 type 2
MKLSYFYQQAVRFGRDQDPRPAKAIVSYEDTAILFGSPETEVKKALLGIDIDSAELLLADRLRQQSGLDLVISHHPEGRAYAALAEVMRLQADILQDSGLKQEVAGQLVEERMEEVKRRLISLNHTRAVDSARLLNMPFVCIHTPADNHVYRFLERLLLKQKPKTVQEAIDILMSIPEYKQAAEYAAGPRILLGNPKRRLGKILLEMTGGTEGNKDAFSKLYKSGVRTVISMHLSEEHFKKTKDANLNVIIAGHISSDNLGLNLLLDRIEQEAGERLEIVECSGFRRVSRY